MRNKRLIFSICIALIAIIFSACSSESVSSGTSGGTTGGTSGGTTGGSQSSGTTGGGGSSSTEIEELALGLGRGYIADWWAVFFNEPNGSSDDSTYVNGIDVPLADAISQVQNTLDIAAFEMNNEVIVEAIVDAHERGVTVRIVTDDEHGIEDKDGILQLIKDLGVPVVDDDRSALMHNKFMIMDSAAVWTGSWNYTVNGTYRNNNNAVVFQNADAVAAYPSRI